MKLFLLVLQIIISVFLILMIILQKSSSDSLSGLGASNQSSHAGTRSISGTIVKFTWFLILAFIINCLVLGNIITRESKKFEEYINDPNDLIHRHHKDEKSENKDGQKEHSPKVNIPVAK